MSATYEHCGGCGAETPSERCIGCLHDFGSGPIGASTTNTAGLEVVGEAGSMPGSSGFTMAAFKADAVPIGTKLVTAASAQAAIDDAWSRAGGTAYALVVEWQARAQAAEARVAELEAAKWEAQHADTMNDLVAMGLARDAAEARADRQATLIKRLTEDLSAALERAYEADADWVKAKYPNGASPMRLIEALLQEPATTAPPAGRETLIQDLRDAGYVVMAPGEESYR